MWLLVSKMGQNLLWLATNALKSTCGKNYRAMLAFLIIICPFLVAQGETFHSSITVTYNHNHQIENHDQFMQIQRDGAIRAGNLYFYCTAVSPQRITQKLPKRTNQQLQDLSTKKPNLERFEYSCRKLWRVWTPWGIRHRDNSTEHVQDPKIYFTTEKWCIKRWK